MKLLFFLTRFPAFGGIETVTDIIGSALIDSGNYTVDVLSILKGDKEMELTTKCNLFYFPETNNWKSSKNRQFVFEVLSQGNYDAFIYQDSYSRMEKFIFPIVDKFNIPIFVFEHNSPLWYKDFTKKKIGNPTLDKLLKKIILFRRWIINYRSKEYLLEHCKHYVLLSSTFVKDLNEVIDIEKYRDKISSINNPIRYNPISKDRLSEKQNTILTVCQLNSVKRVDLMLSLFKKVSDFLPDWSFVIVGDGAERSALEKQAVEQSIPSVKFVGYADPNPYYEIAKIFWMTSVHEGWGMTLVEAMQKGCVPVVMNTFSSLSDIVADNVNGCIVSKDDIDDFISRTIHLSSDADYCDSMANNAVTSVEKYDVKNIINKWMCLLED